PGQRLPVDVGGAVVARGGRLAASATPRPRPRPTARAPRAGAAWRLEDRRAPRTPRSSAFRPSPATDRANGAPERERTSAPSSRNSWAASVGPSGPVDGKK